MGRSVICGHAYTFGCCKITIQVECCCCAESYSEMWEYMPHQTLWSGGPPYEWSLVNGRFYCPTCSGALLKPLEQVAVKEA